jgi:RHS repeat-associated protein
MHSASGQKRGGTYGCLPLPAEIPDGGRAQPGWEGRVVLVGSGRRLGGLPRRRGGADDSCFQNDPVGLPHDLYDSQGELVWSAQYGPFGDANKILEVQDNPLRFQGQYYDAETGLHYNRFRYFDPSIGGFISTDPLGLDAGPDLYGYAPNVWNWIDPFGLACKHGLHSFPKYLKGWAKQTLTYITQKQHARLHAALNQWMRGAYSRNRGTKYFKNKNINVIIKDLGRFYKQHEGGKYLEDFKRAVIETMQHRK